MIRIRAAKWQLEGIDISDPQEVWDECNTLSLVKETRFFDEDLAVVTDQDNRVISVAGIIGLVKASAADKDSVRSRKIVGEVFPLHALMGTVIEQASDSKNPIAYVKDSTPLDAASQYWNQYVNAIRVAV